MRATYRNPSAAGDAWTRRAEVKQRIGNCRRFLSWAWLALWTDSAMFAAVFLNCARDEGDLVISRIVMADGRDTGDLTPNKD